MSAPHDAGTPAGGGAFAVEQLSPDFGFYLRTTELLAEARSPDQHIEIVQTPLFGRAMRIDGCFMTSERDEFFYHEPGAARAAAGGRPARGRGQWRGAGLAVAGVGLRHPERDGQL